MVLPRPILLAPKRSALTNSSQKKNRSRYPVGLGRWYASPWKLLKPIVQHPGLCMFMLYVVVYPYEHSNYLNLRLGKDNPPVFQQFINALHVVRRSDHYWASLRPNQDSSCVRLLKTASGLIRGNGVSKDKRVANPILSAVTSEYSDVMQNFTHPVPEFWYQWATQKRHQHQKSKDQETLRKFIRDKLQAFLPLNKALWAALPPCWCVRA